MKRAWLLFSPLAMCGCATLATPSESVAISHTVLAPAMVTGQTLYMFNQPGKSTSGELFIGDSRDQVSELFPNCVAEDLPATMALDKQTPVNLHFVTGYSAEGYENGASGFGAIYYNKQLALAMDQDAGLTNDQVAEIESAYEDRFKSPTVVTRDMVRYWFWDDAAHNQRLMICAVQSRSDATKFDVTVALGDDVPMDDLRMNPKLALNDSQAFQAPINPAQPAEGS